MKRFMQLILISLTLLLVVGVANAAPPVQEEDEGQVYIVKSGDGLIKLAREFFGDGNAFTRIVEATNAMADSDSSYSEINDPNIIVVGQKLWIPGLTELPTDNEAAETGEETMGDETATESETAVNTNSLAGTNWMLTSLNNASPLPNTAITLEFVDETRAAGSSGCNNYSTTYETDGIRISFGQIAGTLMACVPQVMAQEVTYQQALSDATYFEVTDEMLRLFDDQTTLLAEFKPASSELAGSAWDVISYNNGREAVVTLKLGSSATAVFGEDGQVSGNASCNDYFGPYTAEENVITIGPLASTRMLCPDSEVMDQEAAYLAALEAATTYKITGDFMEMRDENGAMMATFSRMVETEE
jgi:heat shock protein HslJ